MPPILNKSLIISWVIVTLLVVFDIYTRSLRNPEIHSLFEVMFSDIGIAVAMVCNAYFLIVLHFMMGGVIRNKKMGSVSPLGVWGYSWRVLVGTFLAYVAAGILFRVIGLNLTSGDFIWSLVMLFVVPFVFWLLYCRDKRYVYNLIITSIAR